MNNEELNRPIPYQKENYQKGGYITFAAHLRAFAIYSAIYGNEQTAEQLENRHGFSEKELDQFYPEWKNHILK